MEDRELLEMAAKAAGISGEFREGLGLCPPELSERHKFYWNPLDDDGDALRLAVKLHIGLNFDDDCDSVIAGLDLGITVVATRQLDDVGARRAIVRAAAQIGKSMP